MLRITRKAQREHKGWSVWTENNWSHSILAAAGGRYRCRKARLLCFVPFTNYGVFWTFGKDWNE